MLVRWVSGGVPTSHGVAQEHNRGRCLLLSQSDGPELSSVPIFCDHHNPGPVAGGILRPHLPSGAKTGKCSRNKYIHIEMIVSLFRKFSIIRR